jgi:hypothetical protein
MTRQERNRSSTSATASADPQAGIEQHRPCYPVTEKLDYFLADADSHEVILRLAAEWPCNRLREIAYAT